MSQAKPLGMRAVVCGHGEMGCTGLETLLELGVDVPLVVTHAGVTQESRWFRSVGDLARDAGIPVITPADVNAPDALARIKASRPEFLFSFCLRQRLAPRALRIARRGALKLHGSLLPRFRGGAPLIWALLRGETETGVTLHYMDEQPDHGPIVGQRAVPIERDDTVLLLARKLATAAQALLREYVPRLASGDAPRLPQDHAKATHFGAPRPEDGEIDWCLPADRIRNLVRAVAAPLPGAFSTFRSRKLMVWWVETGPLRRGREPGELWLDPAGAPWVATGSGALALSSVGWSGEFPAMGRSWARLEKIREGERFELPDPGSH